MLKVSMFVENGFSGEVKVVDKEVDLGYRENWEIVNKWLFNERVLLCEIFDDVGLKVWNYERGKGLVRSDV